MVMAPAHSPEQLALSYAIELVGRGWTQGAYWRSANGGDCEPEEARRVDLAHALSLAADKYGCDMEELRQLVAAQLHEPYRSDHLLGLERFNDARWRTRGEIVMVLARTLERI